MDFTRGLTGQQDKKAGYPTGQKIAGETAKKMLLERGSQLPTTADIFGEVPDQYFEPDTKLGEGINQLLRGAAKAGQFTSDALVRAPLQSILNVGRMYDKAGKGIGQYAALPTDRKQASIAGEIDQFKRAGIRRNLSPALGIDDELSQLSAALAKKSIPRQTQAEREEMEELSGVPTGSRGSGDFLEPLSTETQAIVNAANSAASGGGDSSTTTTTTGDTTTTTKTTTSGSEFQSGVEGTPEFGVDNVLKDDDKTDEPYNPYGALLESAMKDVAALQGKDPNAVTKEEYMKEFAEATGVNISGEPDKSHALMAFGLALMQNKAGKGFNVSKMLGAVGEAGEKAMPAFQKAKEQARAERIAAGKYALGEVSKDEAQRIASAAKAKERVQELLTKQVDFANERLLKEAEWANDRVLKNAELRAKAIKDQKAADKEAGKITGAWTESPILGAEKLKIRKGYSPYNKTDVFIDGDGTARKLGIAYGNTLQALAEVDNLEQFFTEIQDSPEGATARILGDRAKSLIANLGFPPEDLFRDITYKDFKTGEKVTIKGISAESSATAIQDAILAQFKRFLSQETGNGISEGDYQRLAQLVGQLNAFGNINENKARLKELREFFYTPKRQIESVLAELADRNNFMSDSEYNASVAAVNDVLNTTVGNLQVTQNIDDDGIITYDVRS